MGICSSSVQWDVVEREKKTDRGGKMVVVITHEGSAIEEKHGAKCCDVLTHCCSSSKYVLCDSEGLYVDEKISGVLREGDEVKGGHLYFVLPKKKLEFVLSESGMAALLAKASSALQHLSKNVQPIFFVHHKDAEEEERGQQGLYCCSISQSQTVNAKRRVSKAPRQCHLDTILESS